MSVHILEYKSYAIQPPFQFFHTLFLTLNSYTPFPNAHKSANSVPLNTPLTFAKQHFAMTANIIPLMIAFFFPHIFPSVAKSSISKDRCLSKSEMWSQFRILECRIEATAVCRIFLLKNEFVLASEFVCPVQGSKQNLLYKPLLEDSCCFHLIKIPVSFVL